MRIVTIDRAASSASAQLGDAPEIAVHREDAVGDEDLLCAGGSLLILRGIDVLVRKTLMVALLNGRPR
jgi:hypothetical protein